MRRCLLIPVCVLMAAPCYAAASATYVTTLSDTVDRSTYTFTNMDIGTAAADRCVLVGYITGRATSVGTVSSATIGGNAAAVIKEHTFSEAGNTGTVGFLGLLVTSGTQATVVLNMSTTMTRMIVATWAVTGTSDCSTLADNKDSDVNDPSVSLDVPANGTALGACRGVSTTGNTTTWTGLTERSDAVYENATLGSFGSSDFVSAQTGLTVTCDFSTTTGTETGTYISLGPAAAASGPPMGTLHLLGAGR